MCVGRLVGSTRTKLDTRPRFKFEHPVNAKAIIANTTKTTIVLLIFSFTREQLESTCIPSTLLGNGFGAGFSRDRPPGKRFLTTRRLLEPRGRRIPSFLGPFTNSCFAQWRVKS